MLNLAYWKPHQNMNKILLLGARGQIGKSFLKLLPKETWFDIHAYDGSMLNYLDKTELKFVVNALKPSLIINCAAYTNVDNAELDNQSDIVCKLNIELPKNLAEMADKINAELIHFSTDYVYDGKQNEYYENDKEIPLNKYGLTKAFGDEFALMNYRTKVFRVQSVYSEHNSNFYKAIKKKVDAGEPLRVVSDQFTAPTSAEWIAEQVIKTFHYQSYGIFNLAPKGLCSFADFAEVIADGKVPVERVTYKEYGSKTSRPMVTQLNTSRFQRMFHEITDSWQDVYKDFKSKNN